MRFAPQTRRRFLLAQSNSYNYKTRQPEVMLQDTNSALQWSKGLLSRSLGICDTDDQTATSSLGSMIEYGAILHRYRPVPHIVAWSKDGQ